MKFLLYVSRWSLGAGILFFLAYSKDPLLYRLRSYEPIILILMGVLFLALLLPGLLNRERYRNRFDTMVTTAQILGFFVVTGLFQVPFYYQKHQVQQASPAELRELGRHLVVGFLHMHEARALVTQGAVAGVYITTRNIQGRSVADIAEDIKELQDLRKSYGLPPLLVAADQEGGPVARMSPTIPHAPSLATLLARSGGDEKEFHARVRATAAEQARALKTLGINLNFSPVVDLKVDMAAHRMNLHTRIDRRAIARDPETTTRAALEYCLQMEKNGVSPTLKHFPGLGRVTVDTHFVPGRLDYSVEFLEQNDWKPFKDIASASQAFMMIGHVILPQVDPDFPASASHKLIQGIVRKKWNHQGLLITDDLNMGGAFGAKGGIGQFAVRSLNAGVDLLLLSYDGEQYYRVMYALLKAKREGRLDKKQQALSANRLAEHAKSQKPTAKALAQLREF